MALRIQEQVGGLQVSVDQVPAVQLLQGFEQLLEDLLLVHVLQDVGPDHRVQVSLHIVEHTLDVLVILGFYYVQQPHNVLVSIQFLQEHYLPIGALSICCILKCIEYFFECYDLIIRFVFGFPHNALSSFAQFLDYFLLLQHFFVDMF